MLLLFFSGLTVLTSGYARMHEAHGVTVYRRDDSAIALAAEGEIAAPPRRVMKVLLDYSNHPKWNSHLRESRIIDKQEDSLLVYQRLDLPMLDDRDFSLRVTWGAAEDGELWMRFSTENEAGPRIRDGVVRMRTHEGSWLLTPIKNGAATLARYVVRLDLGGSLPAWMARKGAGKDLPGLFESIRNQVKYFY
jgi:hypothetical protein